MVHGRSGIFWDDVLYDSVDLVLIQPIFRIPECRGAVILQRHLRRRLGKFRGDQPAQVEEMEEAGTATGKVMTIIVGLRGRIERREQNVQVWPEKRLKVDLCHARKKI